MTGQAPISLLYSIVAGFLYDWTGSHIPLYSTVAGFLYDLMGSHIPLYSIVAGFLYDWTGSYSSTFLVAGSGLSLSGIVCLPILCADTLRKQHLNDANTSVTPTSQ